MSAHFNALTGQFLLSEQLIPAGKDQFYDLQNGNIVFGDLLVPKLGNTLFDGATLDLNFANDKSLTDRVSGDNLITFTRASSGTYVDGDGLIKTSPVNLLRYSEEFDNAVWTKISGGGGVAPTVTANAGTAPDGTHTADRIEASATATAGIDYSLCRQKIQTISDDGTFSVYLKSNTGSNQQVLISYILNGTNTGKVVTVTSEWQRFSVTKVQPNFECDIGVALDTENTSDPSIDILAWGAQLEENTTATDYIPTTSTISGAPRFDHDPATGESLGLLIEEARTNEWLGSEDVAGYSTLPSVTVTSNNAIAPDGTNTADTVTYSASQTTWSMFYQGTYTGTYTWSGWLKTNDGSTQDIYLSWGPPSAAKLHTFTVTGEWQRFSGVVTPNNENVHLGNHQTLTPASWNGGVIDVWGIQMELGSFPTSYIPTEGSTVTRAADVAEISGNKFAKTNLLEYSERFDDAYWTTNLDTAVVPNSEVAPDGTLTADTLTFVQQYGYIAKFDVVATSGTEATVSFYAKNIDGNASLHLRGTSSGSTYSEPITVTNEWARYSATFTHDGTYNIGFLIQDRNASGFGSVAIWGAQVEEGDELTEYTPSVESFVSRASSATYVDDTTGLITTTPVNLLIYSEELENWSTNTGAIITANATTAPDGTLTADRVELPSGQVAYTSGNLLKPNTAYTSSIYVKDNGTDEYIQEIDDKGFGGLRYRTTFTFSTKSFAIDGSGSANMATPIYEEVGNGWFRIIQTFTSQSSPGNPVFMNRYGIQDNFLWGAQLEEGTTATTYIPTTSTISGAPRYENGELLLEEARTNIVANSETFSDWNTSTTTKQSNAGISPSGSNDALKIVADAVSGGKLFYRNLTTAANNVVSIYAKAGEYTNIQIRELSLARFFVNFDLSSGTYVAPQPQSGPAGGLDFVSADIQEVGNGWYRCSVVNSRVGGLSFCVSGYPDSVTVTTNPPNFVGDGTSGVYVWGPQVEEGSYPTSYIPTSGTTVTRAADVSTSALGVDSWYNTDASTVYWEGNVFGNPATQYLLWSIQNGQNRNNGIQMTRRSNLGPRFNHYDSSSFPDIDFNGPVWVDNSYRKLAAAIGQTSAGFADSGSLIGTDTTYQLPSASDGLVKLYLGSGNGGGTSSYNVHIKRLAYFPVRKTDEELQELTS